jgi:hypothetical protein
MVILHSSWRAGDRKRPPGKKWFGYVFGFDPCGYRGFQDVATQCNKSAMSYRNAGQQLLEVAHAILSN